MRQCISVAALAVILISGCSSNSEPVPSFTPTHSQSATYQPMNKSEFVDQTSSEIEAIQDREEGWTLLHDSKYLTGLGGFTSNFTSEMAKLNKTVNEDLVGKFAVFVACQGPGSFELELDAKSVAQMLTPNKCGSEIKWLNISMELENPEHQVSTKIKSSDSTNKFRFILLYQKWPLQIK